MTQKPKRSTLLTVLCILTFIGSVYGIGNGVFTYVSADKMENVKTELEKARKEMKDDVAKDENKTDGDKRAEKIAGRFMEEASTMLTKENLQKQAFVAIGASILTLIGALLMWRLKAVGFGVYTLAKIIEVGAPFVIMGSGMLTGLSAAFQGFIALIFIVLYAFCLKEMRHNPAEVDV